jgi:hypothetical protein
MMEGYRNLKNGEYIINGDEINHYDKGWVKTDSVGHCVGESSYYDCEYRRPLPKTPAKKVQKKYPKRIDLYNTINGAFLECFIFEQDSSEVSKRIVKFIQNNYRRRKRS